MIRSSPATRTRRRAEAQVIKAVRAQVLERDHLQCRLWRWPYDCQGDLELAHHHDRSRSKTRRMPATWRHTSSHLLMLCAWHHEQYDRHEFAIELLTDRGCDGPLRVTDHGRVIYEEPA